MTEVVRAYNKIFTFAGDARATTLLNNLPELVAGVHERKISLDDALESYTLCQIQIELHNQAYPNGKNATLSGCGCSIREWFQLYGHSSYLHVEKAGLYTYSHCVTCRCILHLLDTTITQSPLHCLFQKCWTSSTHTQMSTQPL